MFADAAFRPDRDAVAADLFVVVRKIIRSAANLQQHSVRTTVLKDKVTMQVLPELATGFPEGRGRCKLIWLRWAGRSP
jgi:hypothetical protein